MSEKATDLELTAIVMGEEYDLGLKNCYGSRVKARVEYENGKAVSVEIDDYLFTKKSDLEQTGRVLLALADRMPEPAPPKPRKPRNKAATKRATKRATAKRG